MSDNTTEFTKENIDLYFGELSKEYKRLGGRNAPVEIVLIGGAAIVESYGFRNMTTDIDAIIPAIGIMKDAISRAVNDLYGGWSEINEKSVDFTDAILDNQNYREMYAAIRENEQNTKSVMIAFRYKYPDVLDEGNIDSVIENAGQKSESKTSVRETLEMLKKQRATKNKKAENRKPSAP